MFASLVGASFTNEIIALTKAFHHLFPHVGSAIDIGGEDSKFIIFEMDGQRKRLRVKDFSMNTLCAAGTGSSGPAGYPPRLHHRGVRAGRPLKSEKPPRIAGRCTVFAKSDMIHLQQIATPDYELVAGLCFALARNFKSNIAKGKEIKKPLAFIGGVAANAGMRRAIEEVFSIEGELIVPDRFASMGALGAIFAVLDDPQLKVQFLGIGKVKEYLARQEEAEAHEPLAISEANLHVAYKVTRPEKKVRAYLGVDVGSISTNLVLIDEEKNVMAKRYLMTEGRPLEAVKRGLAEIGPEIGALSR